MIRANDALCFKWGIPGRQKGETCFTVPSTAYR